MPTNLPGRKPPYGSMRPQNAAATAGWVLAAASVPALFIALAQIVSPPLVLPTVALCLVSIGFALASWAWLPNMRQVPVRNRVLDVAAVLVFLGFAASILADGDQAIAALESLVADREGATGALD